MNRKRKRRRTARIVEQKMATTGADLLARSFVAQFLAYPYNVQMLQKAKQDFQDQTIAIALTVVVAAFAGRG